MTCAAVIAAAGLSSRMRDFKPLLCLGETTMIESVIQSLREAGVEEIVVVTGYHSELLRGPLSGLGVRSVENVRFAETKMFDSLCLGLEALTGDYDQVFLTPADVPLVRPETLQAMLQAEAEAVRPVCHGTPGHPVLLSAKQARKLPGCDGSGGLRAAMGLLGCPILNLEVEDVGITMDADTPEDLKALRRRKLENRSHGRLIPDLQIHIAKGSVVLTPESAQFLEMIGHTGSIQSACACVHMSYSRGWRLLNQMEKELGYPVAERFPGGTNGGGSVLTEKGRRLLAAYQKYRSELCRRAEELFQVMFDEDLNG